MVKTILRAGIYAWLTWAAAAAELQIRDTNFAVDGKPTFLFGISYYGALGAPEEFIRRDLADMQRYGFRWIRVWATWEAFENDISAVDGKGNAREPFLAKLKWLLGECDRRGMVVDVTLSRGDGTTGEPRLQSLATHRRAVETLVTALKPYRNWYLDMANERNVRDKRFVNFEELRQLHDRAKEIDSARLVTASQAGDISRDDLREFLLTVKVDFVCPHRPRNPQSPGQTAEKTREYLSWMKELGRLVPVNYQEPFRRSFSKWQPLAEDFVNDARGAQSGGAAGWCLHNGSVRPSADGRPRRSFDMREQRLFEQLDDQERQAAEGLRPLMAGVAPKSSLPVVYCTDLFHPHQDPDDHLDLATLFSMPEFDVRAVLLDQGAKQQQTPGRIPLGQMQSLTGRDISYAIGLAEKLRTPQDTGREQAPEYQAAVELFLRVLRESDRPVEVITAGSVRDVVAAFNRQPDLVRAKVARLSINIGAAELGKGEWNVHLDPAAYRRLLESGLPIDWYPCLPLKNTHSAHWPLAHYGDVMDGAPLPLQSFFLYALHRVDPAEIEPLAALGMNLRPWRRVIWARDKNMWCTASLIATSRRKIYRVGSDWAAEPSRPPGGEEAAIFSLVPARIEVDEQGKTARLEYGSADANVRAIQIENESQYFEAMTGCLRNLYRRFPLHGAD